MSNGVVLQKDSDYYILLCVHPNMESSNHVEHSMTIALLAVVNTNKDSVTVRKYESETRSVGFAYQQYEHGKA